MGMLFYHFTQRRSQAYEKIPFSLLWFYRLVSEILGLGSIPLLRGDASMKGTTSYVSPFYGCASPILPVYKAESLALLRGSLYTAGFYLAEFTTVLSCRLFTCAWDYSGSAPSVQRNHPSGLSPVWFLTDCFSKKYLTKSS